MNAGDDKPEERFLSRWSRRKREARAEEAQREPAKPAAETPAAAAGAAAAPAAPAPELPPVEELTLESDFSGFMRPDTDPGLRRDALKKLFAAPHFNVMDGLDVYIDDYGKPDPIPEAMLKTLKQYVEMFPPEEEKPAEADGAQAVAEAPQPAAADGGATLPAEPNAAAPGPDGALAQPPEAAVASGKGSDILSQPGGKREG